MRGQLISAKKADTEMCAQELIWIPFVSFRISYFGADFDFHQAGFWILCLLQNKSTRSVRILSHRQLYFHWYLLMIFTVCTNWKRMKFALQNINWDLTSIEYSLQSLALEIASICTMHVIICYGFHIELDLCKVRLVIWKKHKPT